MFKKTTKELLGELENKNSFWLAWSILWRMWIVAFGIGFTYGLLEVILA